jgi:hypothetical protein
MNAIRVSALISVRAALAERLEIARVELLVEAQIAV